MRLALVLCATLLASCDDEGLYYADGTPWTEASVALLKNDPLRQNPYLRRMPTDDHEWTRFWQVLNAQQASNIGNNEETFTPTWANDFSADPSGDISYQDLGNKVVMWRNSALTGTSDTLTMSFSGLPTNLRPSGNRQIPCFVADDDTTKYGGVIVANDGTVTFMLAQQHGGGVYVFPATGIFTNANSKGLPAGWTVEYFK